MFLIVLAVVLFGFVHPGSKLFLDSGLPLGYFCLLYISCRLLVSAPFLFFNSNRSNAAQQSKPLLIALGLIGSALQFFEFKGISEGLSPGTVTFLMFTFPTWLTLFKIFKERECSADQVISSGLILTGMLYVTGGNMGELKSALVLFPLAAGFCIALWIEISGLLRRKGLQPLELSVYGDLFTFCSLLVIFNGDLQTGHQSFLNWLSFKSFLGVAAYSLLAGLLPNLLFFKGNKNQSSDVVGSIMSFEPVITTFYALLIWTVMPGPSFWLGAAFIFIGNLSKNFLSLYSFKKTKEKALCLD